MDELSQGLSIRNWPVIFKDEFGATVEGRHIEPQVAYSHFVEAFSAGMQLVFDETWSPVDADRASGLLFEYLDKLQIGEIVAIDVDENQEGSIRFLRNGLSQLTQNEQAWRQSHSDSRNTIEQAEFAATVQIVLPQILSSPADIDPTAFERLLITSIDEKAELLKKCPTFWCHSQLMTALRLNRSKLKENDLWDLEHAASALPYVDCFACDGGTRHLCSQVLKLDDKYDTAILSKVDDLTEWVKALSAT